MSVTTQRPAFYDASRVNDWCCLSTDTKPLSNTAGYKLFNGDRMYEIDTGKFYRYDIAANTWIEQPPTGGFSILNKDGEVISATTVTVQTVATQYIVTNYGRQPKTSDALIITLTDKENDKVLYVYSETSSAWINVGIDVDLTNYVGVFAQSFTDVQKSQARTNIAAGTINAINGSPSSPASINADTLNNHPDTYFATTEQLSSKADKLATVKDTTTADITVAATANTNYIYGELTDLTITWGTGSDNAEISFMFKSGATATTLAISTTGAKFSSYAPSANAIVEISAKWYLDAWVVLFHETAVA